MKLIGYTRVSIEEQAESVLRLESQRAKIEAYASLYGHEIVTVICDDGYSAKTLERPGIQKALESISRGEADGILTFKIDRLTQSAADMGGLIDKYFGGRSGKTLVSVSEQIDTTTPAGRLVLNVLASVAQWEQEVTAEKTKAATERMKTKEKRT